LLEEVVRYLLAFSLVCGISIIASFGSAAAQVSGVTDYARLESWVRNVIPKNRDGSSKPPPLRKAAIRASIVIPSERVEANTSSYNLASELISAVTYASGLRLNWDPDSKLENLIIFIDEGYVEKGKLSEKFFSKNKFSEGLEGVLRRSTGWSACYTFALLHDDRTIGSTISIVDDRLSDSEKRKCISRTVINSFGYLVDPAHGPKIEDFYPRYITLAAAVRTCMKLDDYDKLTKCVIQEFVVDTPTKL
jgi:hypothetical protein